MFVPKTMLVEKTTRNTLGELNRPLPHPGNGFLTDHI